MIGNLEDTSFLKIQEVFNCINWKKKLIRVLILFLGPEINLLLRYLSKQIQLDLRLEVGLDSFCNIDSFS